jgi:hypothetical protein
MTENDDTNRQELIDTAVRFLKNPKVVPTSAEHKKIFLLKKGIFIDSLLLLSLDRKFIRAI